MPVSASFSQCAVIGRRSWTTTYPSDILPPDLIWYKCNVPQGIDFSQYACTTFCCWFKFLPSLSSYIDFMIYTIARQAQNSYVLDMYNSTGLQTYINSQQVNNDYSSSLWNNTWYHVAYVGGGSTSSMYIYVNGHLFTAYTCSSFTRNINNNYHWLFYNPWDPLQAPVGYVNDVRFYGRALSASEILALYNASSPSSPTPSATWTPASVGGLVNWYAADVGASGAPVSQWTDQSGMAYDASQSNTAYCPTYNGTGLNNKPTLVFNGAVTGTMLNGVSSTSTRTAFTIAMVLYASQVANMYQMWFNTSGSWNTGSLGIVSVPNTRLLQFALATDPHIANNMDVGYSFTDGTPFLLVWTGFITNGIASMNVYINGIKKSYSVSSTFYTPLFNLTSFNIGCWDGDATRTSSGGISSLILYNTALSTTDRQSLEGYLAWKWWGNGSILPSSHPYYSISR